ncbi:hypothetical protein, partial [Phascolarctobacterium succinatutens]|uniref:hypothetical protein n=1 Tax=Phascolarctobacterium succinatutens TaxID=626940 RepID=UPI0026F0B971
PLKLFLTPPQWRGFCIQKSRTEQIRPAWHCILHYYFLTYLCLELLGLSGSVKAILPSSINGCTIFDME